MYLFGTQLLQLSEDVLELAAQEDIDTPASFIGRIYYHKVRLCLRLFRFLMF